MSVLAAAPMTDSQRSTWLRLQAFALDEPNVILPFSRRLARENGWSHAYSLRVIEEYKRFVFLAMEAGHPVSPAEPVDQAWHLHLVYTESYWQRMCGDVLGRRLHHHPTKGGGNEAVKFDAMYAQTLASYRRLFGAEPPADIWIAAEQKDHAGPHRQRWVDLSSHWVLPKRALLPTALVAVTAVALLTLGGCEHVGTTIFDLPGPKFLEFFVPAAAGGFVLAAIMRWVLCRPHGVPRAADLELDAYEAAYLAGGELRVLQTAVVSLRAAQAVEVTNDDAVRIARTKEPEGKRHDVELLLWDALPADGSAVSLDVARDALRPATGSIEARLFAGGLLSSDAKTAAALATAMAAIMPIVGVVKVFLGLSRNRPVGFLVVLCLISVVLLATFAVRWRGQRRSGVGERLLRQLRLQHRVVGKKADFSSATGITTPATATALFGLSALPALGLASLATQLRPPNPILAGDFGSGGGSSCGSSCGGGGYGGGGCGGCGGGGGD